MRIAHALCCVVAMVTLAATPGMTVMPGASETPQSHSERVMGTVSSQQRNDCVRRNGSCVFKPCCSGSCTYVGKENEKVCR